MAMGEEQSGSQLAKALARRGNSRESSPQKRFFHGDWAAQIMPSNRRDFECPIRAADTTELGRKINKVEMTCHHISESGALPQRRALSVGKPGMQRRPLSAGRSEGTKFIPLAHRQR